MATKAEEEKARKQQTGSRPSRRAKKTARPRAAQPRTSKQARATFAKEETQSGTASRKSSRRSANRVKPDNQLRRRTVRKVRSPKARAQRTRTGAGA